MFFDHRWYPVAVAFLVATSALTAVPLSLEDSFSAAMQKNESLLQSQEQVVQADNHVDSLRGGIFPNLSFNLTQSMQQEASDPAARGFSPQYQTVAYFNATQPIFRGLREWKALAAGESLRDAQLATLEASTLQLYRDITATYLQILSLEQDQKNLAEQSEIYQKRVQELSQRVRRGESNQTDTVTAESTYASLLAEVRLLESQLASAREQFQFLTGLDANSVLTDPKLVKDTKAPALETYLARVDDRPDVRAAVQKHGAADEGVGYAWGKHFPSVDVYGNYYLSRPGFLSDIKWDVGLKLTVPLFEGGATQAAISEAVSVRKQAELEMHKMRRAARQQIKSFHAKYAARLDQLNNLRRAAELSRKNATLLERDYRRGLSKNIDVQLALTEFRVSQRSFDQAYFASQLDLFELKVAAAQVTASQGKDTTK